MCASITHQKNTLHLKKSEYCVFLSRFLIKIYKFLGLTFRQNITNAMHYNALEDILGINKHYANAWNSNVSWDVCVVTSLRNLFGNLLWIKIDSLFQSETNGQITLSTNLSPRTEGSTLLICIHQQSLESWKFQP